MKSYEIKWNHVICGTILQLMVTPSGTLVGHEWACHSSVLYLIPVIILDNSLLRNGRNPSVQPWNWQREWFAQSGEKSKDEREKTVRITHELIIKRITNMYLPSQLYVRKTIVTDTKFWPCITAAATCHRKTSCHSTWKRHFIPF